MPGVAETVVPALKPAESSDLKSLCSPLRVFGGEVVEHIGDIEHLGPVIDPLCADARLGSRGRRVGGHADIDLPVAADQCKLRVSRGVDPIGSCHVSIVEKAHVVLVSRVKCGGHGSGAVGPGNGGSAVGRVGVRAIGVLHAARRKELPAQRPATLGSLEDQHRLIVEIAHHVAEAQFRSDSRSAYALAHLEIVISGRAGRDHAAIHHVVADGVSGGIEQRTIAQVGKLVFRPGDCIQRARGAERADESLSLHVRLSGEDIHFHRLVGRARRGVGGGQRIGNVRPDGRVVWSVRG